MGEHKARERMSVEEQDQARLAAAAKVDRLQLVGARAGASWPSVDDNDQLMLNKLDYVHGEVVHNRKERRAAQVIARKYGCDLQPQREKDENGKDKPGGKLLPHKHGLRCPKYEDPSKERKRVELNPDAPGWRKPRDTDTDPSVDAITALMKDASREAFVVTGARGGKSEMLDRAADALLERGTGVVIVDKDGVRHATRRLNPEKATPQPTGQGVVSGEAGGTDLPTSGPTIAQPAEPVK